MRELFSEHLAAKILNVAALAPEKRVRSEAVANPGERKELLDDLEENTSEAREAFFTYLQSCLSRSSRQRELSPSQIFAHIRKTLLNRPSVLGEDPENFTSLRLYRMMFDRDMFIPEEAVRFTPLAYFKEAFESEDEEIRKSGQEDLSKYYMLWVQMEKNSFDNIARRIYEIEFHEKQHLRHCLFQEAVKNGDSNSLMAKMLGGWNYLFYQYYCDALETGNPDNDDILSASDLDDKLNISDWKAFEEELSKNVGGASRSYMPPCLKILRSRGAQKLHKIYMAFRIREIKNLRRMTLRLTEGTIPAYPESETKWSIQKLRAHLEELGITQGSDILNDCQTTIPLPKTFQFDLPWQDGWTKRRTYWCDRIPETSYLPA